MGTRQKHGALNGITQGDVNLWRAGGELNMIRVLQWEGGREDEERDTEWEAMWDKRPNGRGLRRCSSSVDIHELFCWTDLNYVLCCREWSKMIETLVCKHSILRSANLVLQRSLWVHVRQPVWSSRMYYKNTITVFAKPISQNTLSCTVVRLKRPFDNQPDPEDSKCFIWSKQLN